MARRKSLDSALTSMIESIVRETLRDQLKPLRREVAELRRAVAKTAAAGHLRRGPARGRKGGRRPIHTVCQVQDCNRKHQSRGFCQRHYNRLRNRGTLDDWAAKITAGDTVRESMIAPQRGVPLADRGVGPSGHRKPIKGKKKPGRKGRKRK